MTIAPVSTTTAVLPTKSLPDEDLGVMIYGNIKIKDLDTGKLLVNQRA